MNEWEDMTVIQKEVSQILVLEKKQVWGMWESLGMRKV